MQKAKQNFLYLITGNLANSSNILNVANNVIKLYLIRLYCYKCRLILNNHFLFFWFNILICGEPLTFSKAPMSILFSKNRFLLLFLGCVY